MAAGMGSRYGGLKQIDPIDKAGHIIMDFSIYDAVRAGFEKVVFIIKKENEKDFREAIGDRLSKHIAVEYVFQDLYNIPEGYAVPEGRVKPWGTGHAVLSAFDVIDGPLVVINADDYYGRNAFQMAYDFLTQNADDADCYHYMMTGYILENTLTENGHVARGVCVTDENGYLNVDMVSGGNGKYITKGKAIDITWKKDSVNTEEKYAAENFGVTHYYDADGNEITLNQGRTWVCIIQDTYTDDVQICADMASYQSAE